MSHTFASTPFTGGDRTRSDRRGKLLFFVTEDWFFCSHFLRRAVAAKEAGYEVGVITRVQKAGDIIRSHGLRLIPVDSARRGANPWKELKLLRRLVGIYRAEAPAVVHHVALKPILYGTIAARVAGVPRIVNAPVGMGYAFSSSTCKAKLIRPFVVLAYRSLMNPSNGHVVVENPDDRQFLVDMRMADPHRLSVIKGAGVDLKQFTSVEEPKGVAVVALIARMLWDKGVGEFVQAAELLREERIEARFVLVGGRDPDNPAAITEAQLMSWRKSGSVEWWSHRQDMPNVYKTVNIVCLPSYREGLPKVLIEAAACGRAIVTADVPGCREVVRNGVNGLLVPGRNTMALAQAIKNLILDEGLRRKMGQEGRKIAEKWFSVDTINRETLLLYDALLSQVRNSTSRSSG